MTVETRESTVIYNTKCLAGIEDALVIKVVGEDKIDKKNIAAADNGVRDGA